MAVAWDLGRDRWKAIRQPFTFWHAFLVGDTTACRDGWRRSTKSHATHHVRGAFPFQIAQFAGSRVRQERQEEVDPGKFPHTCWQHEEERSHLIETVGIGWPRCHFLTLSVVCISYEFVIAYSTSFHTLGIANSKISGPSATTLLSSATTRTPRTRAA